VYWNGGKHTLRITGPLQPILTIKYPQDAAGRHTPFIHLNYNLINRLYVAKKIKNPGLGLPAFFVHYLPGANSKIQFGYIGKIQC
jgi:hypothetical protein